MATPLSFSGFRVLTCTASGSVSFRVPISLRMDWTNRTAAKITMPTIMMRGKVEACT